MWVCVCWKEIEFALYDDSLCEVVVIKQIPMKDSVYINVVAMLSCSS